jgi:TetR/AcrR family transcriptional repressor of nem operon
MDLEVLEQAFADVREASMARQGDVQGLEWLARYVGHYLDAEHRDRPEGGCPAPAVIGDLVHADAALRRALAAIIERWSDRIAAHAPETAGASARERALATIALCVGGLTLARSLRGQPLSDDVLRACAAWAVPERASTSTGSASLPARRPARRRPSRRSLRKRA